MAAAPQPEVPGSKTKGLGKKITLPFREIREKLKQAECLSDAKVLLNHKK